MLPVSTILNLSIIVPAIAGIYYFNKINQNYRYFIVSIVTAMLLEYSLEFNLINFVLIDLIYAVLGPQLILLMFFNWDTEKIAFYKKALIQCTILILILIDQYYDYLSIYHIKWGLIACIVGISLYGIRLLTQNQNNLMSEKESTSRKLIIIPYMIFTVYYAAINILMQFLYNTDTSDIFMDLYNVIRWINLLSYISYTLAFIWAPKKEKFL